MAFPRSFKRETWFMRLPTGEVEIASAAELERAFRCGLADARTPLRAVGSHVWTTLADAAEIDTSEERCLGSLLPVALEEPAPDLDSGAPWRVRADDAAPARPAAARAGLVIGTMVAAASAALLIVASARATDRSAEDAGRRAASSIGETSPPVASRPISPGHDLERYAEPEAESRLTESQVRRLRELDAVRRAVEAANPHRTKRAVTSRTPLVPPNDSQASRSPFTNGGHPMDPLNGAL
ncbi:MAG: hypothetical protein KF819_03270 [Labilithrix sp.]|nr:hypothetical protein [Labilithrix sp.]